MSLWCVLGVGMAPAIAQGAGETDATDAIAPPEKREADRLLQQSRQDFQGSQFHEALRSGEAALRLYRRLQDTAGEAATLLALGNAYNFLGHYQASIEHYQRSLDLARAIGDRRGEAHALGSLSIAYQLLGRYQQAIHYLEDALAITREVGDRLAEASSLGNLGNAYRFLENHQKSIDYFEQVLPLMVELGNRPGEATALGNLGFAYYSLGQYPQALAALEKALEILPTVGDRAGEGVVFDTLGRLEQARGNYAKSLEHYAKALDLRRQVGDRAGEGITLHNMASLYQHLDQVALAEVYAYQSLAIIEAIERDLRPNDRDRVAFFEMRSQTYSLLKDLLIQQGKINEALEIADRGRARSLAEFLSPSTSGAGRNILRAEQMQQMARDRNATLITYSMMKHKLLVWVVSPAGTIEFRQIDPTTIGVPIQTALENTSATAINPSNDLFFGRVDLGFSSPWIQSVRSGIITEGEAITRNGKDGLQQGYQLLIQPIENLLPQESGSRLIIVPHQQLGMLPFGALMDGRDRFLMERFTLSIAPSLQVLAAVSDRAAQPRSPGGLLAIGNPQPMPRHQNQDLRPLTGATTEAIAIADFFATEPLLGPHATETAVKQRLESSTILHFATHGIFQPYDHDRFDAWLALAPDPARGEDGKLTLSEIFESNLSAQMAVLSACDTGKGQIAGEGVIGLARAFLKAGTPTVVTSLWAVPDAPTARLMEVFYRELLAGRDRADALRRAQLELRQDYPNPYYWAAFVLIGEGDRPLDLF